MFAVIVIEFLVYCIKVAATAYHVVLSCRHLIEKLVQRKFQKHYF